MADNFLSVAVAGEFPANRLLHVRMMGLSESGLCGEQIDSGLAG
jgi:hypothetical protein